MDDPAKNLSFSSDLHTTTLMYMQLLSISTIKFYESNKCKTPSEDNMSGKEKSQARNKHL